MSNFQSSKVTEAVLSMSPFGKKKTVHFIGDMAIFYYFSFISDTDTLEIASHIEVFIS